MKKYILLLTTLLFTLTIHAQDSELLIKVSGKGTYFNNKQRIEEVGNTYVYIAVKGDENILIIEEGVRTHYFEFVPTKKPYIEDNKRIFKGMAVEKGTKELLELRIERELNSSSTIVSLNNASEVIMFIGKII